MKVLVLGAGGMAGHAVAVYLQENGVSVTGFARRPLPFCHTLTGDAMNTDAVRSALSHSFDVVVNCIGLLPSAAQSKPADAVYLNAYLPRLLALETEGTPARVIHLSTDCVFSGQKGGYTEDAFKDESGIYGLSKSLGELHDNKNLTFRTSIVGPDLNPGGIGLFHWFMGQEQAMGYTRAVWSGVTTMVLAEAVKEAVRQGLSGLYHLVNGESIAKYELLTLFNTLRKNPARIEPSNQYAVDKSLKNTRTDFNFSVPSYPDMVEKMGGWIRRRQALYPYYQMGGVL